MIWNWSRPISRAHRRYRSSSQYEDLAAGRFVELTNEELAQWEATGGIPASVEQRLGNAGKTRACRSVSRERELLRFQPRLRSSAHCMDKRAALLVSILAVPVAERVRVPEGTVCDGEASIVVTELVN